MTFFDLILIGLASSRVAQFLVHEDGIFDIFANMRYAAGIRVKDGDDGESRQIIRLKAGWSQRLSYHLCRLLMCHKCVGIIAAIIFTLVSSIGHVASDIFVMIFAASMIEVYLGSILDRLEA